MPPGNSNIPYLPTPIRRLPEIAFNLFWSWCPPARALFRRIDPTLWSTIRHNPLALLQEIEPAVLAAAARDPELLALYDEALSQLDELAASQNTWFRRSYPDAEDAPIAYFCAEFGIHSSLPIYSGGLGILAGDHCKAASDLGVPLIGVGLAYHKGYFDQKLSDDGWQEDADEVFDPTVMPLKRLKGENGDLALASVETANGPVHVGAWEVRVGRTRLLLLDTDIDGNAEADRELTHKLYGGGQELRLKQEWILGIGGVRVLRALGIEPGAWHANEGHAAFMLMERMREDLERGASIDSAREAVRSRSLFTTHTPVPAGHDSFSMERIEECLGPCWEGLLMDRATFLDLGRHPTIDHDTFHMTAVAMRLSGATNGVSRKHGAVTRRLWNELWPEVQETEVPIGHVTNGVHRPTWMSRPMRELVQSALPGADLDDPKAWDGILGIDDHKLWGAHVWVKNRLFDFVRQQARIRWRDHWTQAGHLAGAGPLLDPNALTLGFARRFASYKRADLLFRNEGRLLRLLTNPKRPVQIIFAGKAHPADDIGKQVLQKVFQYAGDPRFEGRIAFLEDYESHLAHRLVEGVDVWLNMPRVPMEACGTSGMKAAMNGVPQLGTLDGWWAEGYTGMNGWVIPLADEDEDTDRVDETDWDQLFTILEEEVVPLYHDQDADGVPIGWVQRMKHAMREGGRHFAAAGMVRKYANEYYVPALRGEVAASPEPVSSST